MVSRNNILADAAGWFGCLGAMLGVIVLLGVVVFAVAPPSDNELEARRLDVSLAHLDLQGQREADAHREAMLQTFALALAGDGHSVSPPFAVGLALAAAVAGFAAGRTYGR